MTDPNEHEPVDHHDPHLGDRMERAVGGLRAPDVVPGALARGRRQRTHRRLAYGAGGLAAASALALALPAVAQDWPGRGQGPATSSLAADPSATAPSPTPAAPATTRSDDDPCGGAATGWWSRSAGQIEAELAALLPDGVRVGATDDDADGAWGGNLVTGQDQDFASLTLLAPPGTPGGPLTLEELRTGGPCAVGDHAPQQAVRPCDELTGYETCEEIRSEDGEQVGVVTEKLERTVVAGQEQATDHSYVTATVAVPGGGHVELYVAEGTRADRPTTVHDPADVPALTRAQARAIVVDPGWTS